VLRDTARRKAYDDELSRQRPPGPNRAWSPPMPGAGTATSSGSPRSAKSSTEDLPDLEPDEVPVGPVQHTVLRFAPVVVLAVVLLVILIVSAYASSDREDPPLLTTERAPVGSCVEVAPLPSDPDEAASARPELVEVDCRRPGVSRVVAKVSINRPCPTGSTAFPVAEENLSVCLQ
jgi:hypothetical protein